MEGSLAKRADKELKEVLKERLRGDVKVKEAYYLGLLEGTTRMYHATSSPEKEICDIIREGLEDFGIESPSCDECYKMHFEEK